MTKFTGRRSQATQARGTCATGPCKARSCLAHPQAAAVVPQCYREPPPWGPPPLPAVRFRSSPHLPDGRRCPCDFHPHSSGSPFFFRFCANNGLVSSRCVFAFKNHFSNYPPFSVLSRRIALRGLVTVVTGARAQQVPRRRLLPFPRGARAHVTLARRHKP